MKKTAALLALFVAAVPALALADSLEIGNLSHHTVKYQIRCDDGNDSWHKFQLANMEHSDVASGDWNYSCDTERYTIRIGTDVDGDTQWNSITATPGNQYALVYNNKDRFAVLDTRTMVGIVNPNSNKINFSFTCIEGSTWSSHSTVKPKDVDWFQSSTCTSYRISIKVNHDDGSTTEQTRVVAPNNVYEVRWEASRGVYDFVKV